MLSPQARWDELSRNEIIQSLEKGTSAAELFTTEQTAEARDRNSAVMCSDERVPGDEKGKIGLAGSLLLASDREIDSFVAHNRGSIDEITSHEGCGAAQLKFDELKKAGALPVGITTAKELAVTFAQRMAAKLGAEYRHVPKKEMKGELHDARMIWVDGTGTFRPYQIPKMPSHFISSGAGFGMSPEYVAKEVGVLASIAFGNHGFGERFNHEHPLNVLIAAKDEEQLRALKEAMEKKLPQYKDRIRYDGVVIGGQDVGN